MAWVVIANKWLNILILENEDIRILKWKGIAIENIFYQDYLDGSPIEETLLILIEK